MCTTDGQVAGPSRPIALRTEYRVVLPILDTADGRRIGIFLAMLGFYRRFSGFDADLHIDSSH